MKTSSNGNIFRVTGHLGGEFTSPGEFPTQRPVTQSFDVFFDLCPNNGWVNNREAGDLRRYRAHCDIIVIDLLSRTQPWCFPNRFSIKCISFISLFFVSFINGNKYSTVLPPITNYRYPFAMMDSELHSLGISRWFLSTQYEMCHSRKIGLGPYKKNQIQTDFLKETQDYKRLG